MYKDLVDKTMTRPLFFLYYFDDQVPVYTCYHVYDFFVCIVYGIARKSIYI